jgi:signal transduction histidine kinase
MIDTPLNATAPGDSASQDFSSIRHAIEHAKHYLPSQGPIAVFIHHNTLHAFESLPFDEAVIEGLRTYGSQPYWQESRYRDEMSRDRIQLQDLQIVLKRDLGESGLREIAIGTTRFDLRYNMLRYSLSAGSNSEIRWLMAQSDALEQFQPGVEPQARNAILEATRHWIMRDLRLHLGDSSAAIPPAIRSVFDEFPIRSIESWSDSTWQRVTLQLLWRICQNGVRGTRKIGHTFPSLEVLVNQLLLLAETESETETILLSGESIDLGELIKKSYEMFIGVAESRSIDLRLQVVQVLRVKGNRHHLRQVVNNLIDNALKFTPEGGNVSLTIDKAAGESKAIFTVQDTGVGIAAEEKPQLFDRFYRGERSRRRDSLTRGTGLGLSICRAIVDGHGGSITVTSQVGQGSSFQVWLPLFDERINA